MDEKRILDENDVELTEDDLDFELGYLELDEIFKEHHDAIQGQERISHFRVVSFHFDDGTTYSPEGEDDPHVDKKDVSRGIFDYIPGEGEEEKHVFGWDLEEIVDQQLEEPREAWDEYEEIQRYKLYTQKELEDRKYKKQQEEKQEELLATGLDRIVQLEEDLPATEEAINENIETINQNYELLDESLAETNMTVEDLVLLMADILGGEEEYPEEE